MASTLGQLHKSKTHRDGLDPNCPQCLKDEGIDGIIEHLTKCAAQNEHDYKHGSRFPEHDRCVAMEQRRMIAILKLYRMHCPELAVRS